MLHSVSHCIMVAAFQSVGQHDHQGTTRKSGEAWHGEESAKRVADARTTIPIGYELRGHGERLVTLTSADCPRDSGQTRAQGEDFESFRSTTKAMGKAEITVSLSLHRARDVDQNEDSPEGEPTPHLRQMK